jgi:hypothetical protein
LDDSKSSPEAQQLLCRQSVRISVCPAGHIEIRNGRTSPWFMIQDTENWDNRIYQGLPERYIPPVDVGNIEALLKKRLLQPLSCIMLDSHCNNNVYAGDICFLKTKAEVEILIGLPRALIFNLGQRSGSDYNCSGEITFPPKIEIENSATRLIYKLTGKLLSANESGYHYTAKVARQFFGKDEIYFYDDLSEGGMAQWTSSDLGSLALKEPNTVLAAYSLSSSEEDYQDYLRERIGKTSTILERYSKTKLDNL